MDATLVIENVKPLCSRWEQYSTCFCYYWLGHVFDITLTDNFQHQSRCNVGINDQITDNAY